MQNEERANPRFFNMGFARQNTRPANPRACVILPRLSKQEDLSCGHYWPRLQTQKVDATG